MYIGDMGDTASGGCDSVMTRWRPCGYSGQSSGGHSALRDTEIGIKISGI